MDGRHVFAYGSIVAMKLLGRAVVAGFGLVVAAWVSAQPAVAQYYGGQGYGYDRRYRDGYDRRDFRRDDGRGPRFGGGDGYGRGGGYGRRAPDPMAGMTLDERKRAIKNEREAQKRAFKRGQLFR
ncbi:MAG: hypothetical protein J0I42_19205 [Bosea sp.]|uniref:hypothetical protein n=1 Tax=Bosea sp. (in: a-proteobacteria) TaxID=1871050 RepID=UPI001AC9A2D9|nr:hypothetical protein [Bosea sp. (in: a-proteobacteria)]MBN9454071.1 hypothetical protein [Bosea sp. (in: a-proteobacteria)]